MPERIIQSDDAGPVGFVGRVRSRMTGGDGCLERVDPICATQRFHTLQCRKASTNQEMIPPAAVLL